MAPLQLESAEVLLQVIADIDHTSVAEDAVLLARMKLIHRLGWPMTDGRSLARTLRENWASPGELPSTGDAVADVVIAVVPDAYPLMLVPEIHAGSGPEIGSAVFSEAVRRNLEDVVMADSDLARRFVDAGDGAGLRMRYTAPSNAASLQLSILPHFLLKSAWYLSQMEDGDTSVSAVIRNVSVATSRLRRVARGESVDVPVRVGLTGVKLPVGHDGFVGRGIRVRQADQRDEWLPQSIGLVGSTSMSYPDGSTVEVQVAGDLVVEVTMPFFVKWDAFDQSRPWPLEMRRPLETVRERVEQVRLALALVGPSDNPPRVQDTWMAYIAPVGQGLILQWPSDSHIERLSPQALTEEQVVRWKEYTAATTVDEAVRVRIALHRALVALTERSMVEDVLIDAVMVWENLFGAAGDTTLRVCGSLARLLAQGDETRNSVFDQTKKIYELRSRVVHGSAVVDDKSAALPRQALEIALDALRAVFVDRPELLKAKDGAERSRILLLGS